MYSLFSTLESKEKTLKSAGGRLGRGAREGESVGQDKKGKEELRAVPRGCRLVSI